MRILNDHTADTYRALDVEITLRSLRNLAAVSGRKEFYFKEFLRLSLSIG